MASRIPYDTTSDALLHPAKSAVFFQGWNPDVDNRNHDLLCAEMSRLAYAPPEVVRPALQGIGFTSVDFFGGEGAGARKDLIGTQGFMARNPSGNLTVVAFRGTESDKFEDLLSDGRTLQKEWPQSPGCLVHAGFADCWNSASHQVNALLAKREGTLLITGHSLGAALATLAAVSARPTKLITFGSPRVGNEKLGALLAGIEVRRIVHCCDLIARIPPERFDPEHVDQLLTELDLPSLHGLLARPALPGANKAITFAFGRLGLDPRFAHVSPERYGDRNGRLQGSITDEDRRQDQETARRAFKQPAAHESFRPLNERLQELLKMPTHGDALQALHSFMGHLFARAGTSVAFRDLADHAPVNYVSLFTGRN